MLCLENGQTTDHFFTIQIKPGEKIHQLKIACEFRAASLFGPCVPFRDLNTNHWRHLYQKRAKLDYTELDST